jgi:DNA-binding beta-propeller fold protein YncE
MALAVAPDGSTACIAPLRDRPMLVDLPGGRTRAIECPAGTFAASLFVDASGRTVYLAAAVGTPMASKVLAIDRGTGRVTATIPVGRSSYVTSLGPLLPVPDSSRAFALHASERQLVLLDLEARAVARRATFGDRYPYTVLALARDGQRLFLVGGAFTTPKLLAVNTRTLRTEPFATLSGDLNSPVVAPDGRSLYLVHNHGDIVRLDASSGRELARWKLGGSLVALEANADRVYVLRAGQAGAVLALDAASGKVVAQRTIAYPTRLLLGAAPKKD